MGFSAALDHKISERERITNTNMMFAADYEALVIFFDLLCSEFLEVGGGISLEA